MAPASLLENWQRELALWCPSLRVAPYFGAARIDLRDELEDWRCGLLRVLAQMQGPQCRWQGSKQQGVALACLTMDCA